MSSVHITAEDVVRNMLGSDWRLLSTDSHDQVEVAHAIEYKKVTDFEGSVYGAIINTPIHISAMREKQSEIDKLKEEVEKLKQSKQELFHFKTHYMLEHHLRHGEMPKPVGIFK